MLACHDLIVCSAIASELFMHAPWRRVNFTPPQQEILIKNNFLSFDSILGLPCLCLWLHGKADLGAGKRR